MRAWVLWAVLLLSPVLAWSQACTHYASPTGSGSTCTLGSPCLINSFWSIASLPGKVLCLNDGTYTGANSMITPPAGTKGTSGNPITIRALNDGQVLLDGQNARVPVDLLWNGGGANENTWFVIDGINATNGTETIYHVSGSDNLLQRVMAWNGTVGWNNNAFQINGYRSRAVDCAGWGTNLRKIFSGSQAFDNLQGAGFKRCWGEWNDWPVSDNWPTETYQGGYNTTNQLFENTLGTWNSLGDISPEPDAVFRIFFGGGVPPFTMNGTQILGSIFYTLTGATFSPGWVFQADEVASLYMEDVVAFLDSTRTTQRPFYMYGCGVEGACTSNVCQNCLAVHAGTPLFNDATSGFTFPSLHQGNGLAAATGGTSAFTLLPGICTRYENGTLTSTPLWPWPMDERIRAARVAQGYRDVTVTAEIESILGTIPAACRSDGGGPTFLAEVTGLDLTGNATIAFLGEVTGLDLTAGSTAGTLGEVTGLDLTGNASITFLGEVTGLDVTVP